MKCLKLFYLFFIRKLYVKNKNNIKVDSFGNSTKSDEGVDMRYLIDIKDINIINFEKKILLDSLQSNISIISKINLINNNINYISNISSGNLYKDWNIEI